MSIISLSGMSELALLGLVERAEAVLHPQAECLSETNRRLESRINIDTVRARDKKGLD
jgi:hypothetical protein